MSLLKKKHVPQWKHVETNGNFVSEPRHRQHRDMNVTYQKLQSCQG